MLNSELNRQDQIRSITAAMIALEKKVRIRLAGAPGIEQNSMQEKQEKIRLTLLWLSMVLYVAACLTTALIFKREGSPNEAMPGWNVLAVGWVGMLINQWGWFANLFLLLGLIFGFLRLFRAGKISTSIALLVSAVSIPMLFSQDVPANEGGVGPPFKLAELGIGCWLWLGSQLLVLAGNFGKAKKCDSAATKESETNRD